MDEGIVRMQAQMFALVAEMNAILVSVEGMKAANTERESQGFALAYPESIFNDASKDLEGIATALRNQI
jgi:hypothetical protein